MENPHLALALATAETDLESKRRHLMFIDQQRSEGINAVLRAEGALAALQALKTEAPAEEPPAPAPDAF